MFKPVSLILILWGPGSLILINDNAVLAQDSLKVKEKTKETSIVTKKDQTRLSGRVINRSQTTLLLLSDSLGYITIPNNEILSIRTTSKQAAFDKKIRVSNTFSSRYYITSGALRMKTGDTYAMINYWGIDFKFALTQNLSLSLTPSWILAPVFASIKFSVPLGSHIHFALGIIAGTASWIDPTVLGFLPFGAVTLGDRDYNLSFSGGYGKYIDLDGSPDNAPVYTISGMARIGKKLFLVGESIIYIHSEPFPFTLIMPGIRYAPFDNVALNFAIGGLYSDQVDTPGPIPFVSLYLKLNKSREN